MYASYSDCLALQSRDAQLEAGYEKLPKELDLYGLNQSALLSNSYKLP